MAVSMNYDEITRALDETRWLLSRAETAAAKAVPFAVGRLRYLGIDTAVLRALKRELRDFDMTTGKWK